MSPVSGAVKTLCAEESGLSLKSPIRITGASRRATDYEDVKQGARVEIPDIRKMINSGKETLTVLIDNMPIQAKLEVSERHRAILLAGGLLNWAKKTA